MQWGEKYMKYAKTEIGQLALKERSPQLTLRQRSAMILFDGKKTVDEVLAATEKLGVVSIDIDHLLALGYIGVAGASDAPMVRPAPVSAAVAVDVATAAGAPAPSKSECFIRAWPLAIRLAGSLGLRGFRLKTLVGEAAGYDELVALLPALTDVLGPEKVRDLKEALGV
jgi:hypothetical protein